MKQRLYLIASLFMVALLLGSCSSKYPYEKVKGDPLKTRIYTLKNGLKVYMSVNDEAPRIQASIAVKVGGKNDPVQTTGLAHYFEHLMFKGTEQFGTMNYEQEKVLLDQIEAQFEIYRTKSDEAERKAIYKTIDSLSYEASRLAIPNEYDKLMAAIGARGTNAYTGYDQTVYIEDIPSNQIDNWAKIQADRFRHNVIRGFHTELETVYEEKNMSLTSDDRKVLEATLSSLFPNHPYGSQTVLGTQEHLKNPSITTIKKFFETWYVPNNMAICLSGDLDYDQMMTTIDKYFGSMEPSPNLPELHLEEVKPVTEPIVKTVLGPNAESVTLGWITGGARSEDADKLNILSSILYNGKAGLWDLNLLQQQKILYGYAFFYDFTDHGMIYAHARPKSGQSLDEVKVLMLGEIEKLKSGDFDESLLEATLNNYRAGQMRVMDSNRGRSDMFVSSFINEIPWIDEVGQLERMKSITKADIVELAGRIFGENNYSTIYKRQGKDPSEVKMPKPEITPIFVNRDTSSLFLREVQAAQVKPIAPVFIDFNKDLRKVNAKSNTPLLYSINPTNGLFSLVYIYETGSNNDKMSGIAFDYLKYLGTSKLTPEQVSQEFYRIACSFTVYTANDRSYIMISGLSDNMERAMELMESLIADAQPNPEALENMKADILKKRADAKLNQSANFQMLMSYARYGAKSPATNVLSATEVGTLTPEHLLGRIKNLGAMEHRILYYGPMKEKAVMEKINAIHNIPETPNPAPEMVRFPSPETTANSVLIAHYDAKQIYYGQISNSNQMYSPSNDAVINMYNGYFGGSMNSIVFQEMREARGLAYSANSSLGTPTNLYIPYVMSAFIATQSDKMGEAIETFQDIINNMPESESAFQLAKEAILARISTERIIESDILWEYVEAQDMGVDYDRRKGVYEAVQAMTLADVKAFQQEWIKDRNYTYAVLGDLNEIDLGKLAEYGPVKRLSQEEIFGY